MIKLHFDEKLKDKINEKQLQKILKIFIKQLFEQDLGINVYITDDKAIQKLNKKFRSKDSPTDILSWAYKENDLEVDANEIQILAGEIMISADRVRVQSMKNGWDFKTELIRLLAHGCAHIAGFDHEKSNKEAHEMLDLEISLLKKVGLNSIY